MYKTEKLKNGLRVVSYPIKNRDSVSIGFWVDVGGRHEEGPVKGAAHFLEHIVFKGTKKYSCDQIKNLIEGVGGTLNAFTSEEQTCFYAKIPSKHLKTTFDVLADMVFYPTISAKDVKSEKTVILEEIKMYRDMPQYYVLDQLDSIMWPKHPLGKSLAGTHETVSQLSAKALRGFHDKHYSPHNIVLAICGNFSHASVMQLVKRKLSKLKQGEGNNYLNVEGPLEQPRLKVFKKDIEQMHLAIGLHSYDENNPDRYVASLLSTILGGNMSSRLFVEVREKRGLAYSISASNRIYHDTGAFIIRAGVDNTKLVDAIKLILKELKKISTKGVFKDEFKRSKDYLLGQMLLGLEGTMDHMLWIGEGMITKNKVKPLKSIVKIFDKITIKDVNRVAKEILQKQRLGVSIVGPLSTKQEKEIRKIVGILNK